ncbi:tetratricopeptide repeat protein [Marinobacter confluentis]|uniref:Tetratricopeptide repeat protein n=1 Tax=Marinobacter confluentis TaxID=1697557 RepID=A0A4Z1BXB0_9GAMM|nr:tetratricopeptide repeat protein [Marinobacter confluentis]TGN41869.1 tetratricopeptide repeat protein [Marinobacter confluentis]
MTEFNSRQTRRKTGVCLALLSASLLIGGCAMAPMNSQEDQPAATEVLEAWKQADQYYARGQFTKARESYQLVHQRQPDNPDVLLKLANIAYYLQEHDRARDLYAEIEDIGSSNPRFYYNRAALNLTSAYRDLAQYRADVGPGEISKEIRAVMAAIERMSEADRPDTSNERLSPLEAEEAQ